MPSTAIGRIEYDETTRRLFVTFVITGRRYVYFDVPADEAAAFRRAFSKGAWFNTHIRDRYAHELVDDPRAERCIVRTAAKPSAVMAGLDPATQPDAQLPLWADGSISWPTSATARSTRA